LLLLAIIAKKILKTKSEKTGFGGFQSPEVRAKFLSKKQIAGVISHTCGILLCSQICPRMIKDFWSIARFDYTILGIIATFSASANESSPLSLQTEIP
jgi:hypothetical protein